MGGVHHMRLFKKDPPIDHHVLTRDFILRCEAFGYEVYWLEGEVVIERPEYSSEEFTRIRAGSLPEVT